jgi:hypothetical protein
MQGVATSVAGLASGLIIGDVIVANIYLQHTPTQ